MIDSKGCARSVYRCPGYRLTYRRPATMSGTVRGATGRRDSTIPAPSISEGATQECPIYWYTAVTPVRPDPSPCTTPDR